jgi:hypothetical protein
VGEVADEPLKQRPALPGAEAGNLPLPLPHPQPAQQLDPTACVHAAPFAAPGSPLLPAPEHVQGLHPWLPYPRTYYVPSVPPLYPPCLRGETMSSLLA